MTTAFTRQPSHAHVLSADACEIRLCPYTMDAPPPPPLLLSLSMLRAHAAAPFTNAPKLFMHAQICCDSPLEAFRYDRLRRQSADGPMGGRSIRRCSTCWRLTGGEEGALSSVVKGRYRSNAMSSRVRRHSRSRGDEEWKAKDGMEGLRCGKSSQVLPRILPSSESLPSVAWSAVAQSAPT